jgi:predicted RNA-binding protein YlqC (UPF0109 family)
MKQDPQPSELTREFIEYVAGMLARNPDEVQVTDSVDEKGIVYRIKLSPDDVGRVIGREGRIIQSMRTLLRAAAVRQGTRFAIEVD